MIVEIKWTVWRVCLFGRETLWKAKGYWWFKVDTLCEHDNAFRLSYLQRQWPFVYEGMLGLFDGTLLSPSFLSPLAVISFLLSFLALWLQLISLIIPISSRVLFFAFPLLPAVRPSWRCSNVLYPLAIRLAISFFCSPLEPKRRASSEGD